MKIKLLKNHLDHKAEDVVNDHPNAAYLVKLGVAEEVTSEKVETDHKKEKVDMVKPTTKKKR